MGTSASVMQQEEANLKYAHNNNLPPAAGEPIKAEEKHDFSHGAETEKTSLSDEKPLSPPYYNKPIPGNNYYSDAKDAKGGGAHDAKGMSLLESMLLSSHSGDGYLQSNNNQLSVGDIVRVRLHQDGAYQVISPRNAKVTDYNEKEGIIIEKVTSKRAMVDFGESIQECVLEDCSLLLRSDEFEIGDKVEARPSGSNLYFVGKVINVNNDKEVLDVLMEGDDPNDIEYSVPFENTRKLMSRRSIVQLRWRRAFMLVIAANFFKRIQFNAEHK